MHKKILVFILLASWLYGPYAKTAFLAPYLNLSITKNAIGDDGIFNFQIQAQSNAGFIYLNKDISIQTTNGFGSSLYPGSSGNGDIYFISEAPQTGWQNTGVNCSSDNPQVSFASLPNGVVMTAYGFSNVSCNFTNTKQASRVPVLIVPGILGTELKSNDTILWASVLRMVNPLNSDSFMDPLAFKPDLSPSDQSVFPSKIIDNPDGLFNYSEALVQELVTQGYTEGSSSDATLFTFPYDWRYGVSGTIGASSTPVDLFKHKIDDILAQTGTDKVDVIAHSTGGLLLKKYVVDHPTDNNIGKAIFVGVPNLGAPQAVKVLLQGDNFGVRGLEDSEMKKIAVNLPVTYDLAPSQKYFDDNGSFVRTVTSNGFGSDTKNLDYSQTDSFLTGDHKFNSQALTGAHNLHNGGLDDFDMRTAGVDVYSIVGCKSGTLGSITERRVQEQAATTIDGYDVKDITGDGTVPMQSAQSLRANSENIFYAINADHGKMPSADGIRQKIVNILAGTNLSTGTNIISNADLAQDPSKCELSGHWWEMLSPVSINITDQNGNQSGIAADGSVQNNIPGADYQVMGEHKFIFVPTDSGQQYAVNLKGTGTGTFTFKDGAINNGQDGPTQVFSNLPVTPSLVGTVNIGNIDTLSLDTNGDGTVDQTIQPTSIINTDQAEDINPPVSTSTILGLMGAPGFYRGNATVTLSAVDPIINQDPAQSSGVLGIKYSLDGSPTTTYAAPFSVTAEGKHSVSFFATDNAGNNELPQTMNFTIDKTPPEFVMQFNIQTKDLQFSGTDNISTTSAVNVLDADDTVTLTDQAGNTTQIKLGQKNRKIVMAAAIKSLLYNSQPADISKNILAFGWLYDKNKNLTALSQNVQSKNGYNILAVYGGKNTLLIGKDQTGSILKTLTGLVLLKVTTNRGDFSWGY